MAQRKNISASLRWSVFARDGFACRYCGAQAGQDGVELHADHILSVADGGDNSFDNLAAACQRCNGGKGARSLKNAPTDAEVVDRIKARAATMNQQANAMAKTIEEKKKLEQEAVNLKCEAYQRDSIPMEQGEHAHIVSLCKAYGADLVLSWYESAYRNECPAKRAIKYVYGCVRNHRKTLEGEV